MPKRPARGVELRRQIDEHVGCRGVQCTCARECVKVPGGYGVHAFVMSNGHAILERRGHVDERLAHTEGRRDAPLDECAP
jgi:hypothetical protein